MAKYNIDYKQVISNMEEMIGVLEYDSMRSPGKAKMNAMTLMSLYSCVDRYTAMLAKKAVTKKEA
jgi:hypothetical protein